MALADSTNPMQGVSGPGEFSKRTDLQYQSDAYGDGVAYDAAKAGAPLARAQKSPMLSESPVVPTGVTGPSVGLYDKTNRPDEPVTAGIDMGAGPGSDALAMRPNVGQKLSDTLVKMIPYDPTGEINLIYQQALARGM